jgi:hypothetical protein
MSPRSAGLGANAVRGVELAFDIGEATVFVDHSSLVHLETSADVDAYFDAVAAYWRREVRGEKVYFVVSYDNFSSNPAVSERYAERVRAMLTDCALGVVRHGGDVPQRTTARRLAIMLHVPSNLCETREDAIEAVRGMRRGAFGDTGAPRQSGTIAAGAPMQRQSGTMSAAQPRARASRAPKRRQSND